MSLGPVILEGVHVQLEPLRLEHADALSQAAQANNIWSWMSVNLSHRPELDGWVTQSVQDMEQGLAYPFAVIDKKSGNVVGSTRYMNIHERDRGVEIGWTWYSPIVWGTPLNPEAKLILLQHAFDDWEALRVELRTDHRNTHSQAAIRKLGAKYEGMLRNHRIRADGTIRHTVVFSITREEWPSIHERLQNRLKVFNA